MDNRNINNQNCTDNAERSCPVKISLGHVGNITRVELLHEMEVDRYPLLSRMQNAIFILMK